MFLPPEEVWIDHRPLDLSGNITSLVTGQSPFSHRSVMPEDTRDKKSPEGKARQRLDLAGRSVFHWFFLTYPFPSLCRVCSSMLTASLSWVWRNLWDHRVKLSALAPTMGYSETLEWRDNLRTLTSPNHHTYNYFQDQSILGRIAKTSGMKLYLSFLYLIISLQNIVLSAIHIYHRYYIISSLLKAE